MNPTVALGRVEARLARDLDRAADRAAVVAAYAARFPHLAAGIRAFAAFENQLRAAFAPPAGRLAPGTRLGEFVVGDRVDTGGMGEVYRAAQVRLGRTVALKVIHGGRPDGDARARFDREQLALARLHHTHVVPIFAAGEDGDVQYYAMAFIPGASLARVVRAAYARATAGAGPVPAVRGLVGDAPSAVPPDPAARVRLSMAYFRSVAEVLAQAAEAVQHAHDAGVGHRDIKPSNLMVDPAGHAWVIDFGLAGLTTTAADPGAGEAPAEPGPCRGSAGASPARADADPPGPGSGTWPYMAPEQHAGRPEFRSDVWGLGATLYELLALRRSFDGPTREDIARAVREADPRPVRDLSPCCPRDLAAICTKALRKHPTDRYDTPAAFAADLRRWLDRQPTTARRLWPVRPAVLWASRNKALAAAILCAVAAGVGLGRTAYTAAEAREAAADEREFAADERRKDQEVGRLLLESTNLRMAAGRVDGWSTRAWAKAAEAARLRPRPEVRDALAATLVGLDAEAVKRFDELPGLTAGWNGVAFSADGRRVVAGGTGGRPTWLWDRRDADGRTIAVPGGGPVGFRGGVAVQVLLPTPERPAVVLWDLDANKAIGEIAADPLKGEWASAVLTPDVGLLAVAYRPAPGPAGRLVWEVPAAPTAGVLVCDLEAGTLVRRVEGAAAALALSPDGRALAVGGFGGEVTVWPLPGGDPSPAVRFGRTPVWAVAFARPLVGVPGWRVAAGDEGGMVTVWETARPAAVVRCRGSRHEVLAVAFSPDGMTLASTGRRATKLWDAATGRPLLDLARPDPRDRMTGLAFGPDGAALAVGSVPNVFGGRGGADVWHLHDGRGVRTLRGLTTPVSRFRLSADGTHLAALSHDWQVAVWDLVTGRLVARLDVPRVSSADSAGLAFRRDNRRLAFAAGSEAGEWDLTTGERVGRWPLPRGLNDQLGYHPDGGLYLFRVEFAGELLLSPRVGRLRELRPGGWLGRAVSPSRLVAEYGPHPGDLEGAGGSPDGRYFVVHERHPADGRPSVARAYDAATGRELWSGRLDGGSDAIGIDPTGAALYRQVGPGPVWEVVEMPAGRAAGGVRRNALTPGPGAGLTATPFGGYPLPAIGVYRGDEADPLVTLPFGAAVSTKEGTFTADGRHLVWGNADGSVSVWDLAETGRRLTGLGLGW